MVCAHSTPLHTCPDTASVPTQVSASQLLFVSGVVPDIYIVPCDISYDKVCMYTCCESTQSKYSVRIVSILVYIPYSVCTLL